MDTAMTNDAADAAEPSDPVTDTESVATHVAGWFTAHRERIRIISELALAEAKLAATSVAMMAFLGTVTAILVLTSWCLIVAGGIFALLAVGAPLWAMLVVLAIVHLLVAGLLARKVLALSKHLGFVATREQLQSTGASS